MLKHILGTLLISSVLLAACGGAAPEPAAPAEEVAPAQEEEAQAPAEEAEAVELKIAHFMSPKHPMHAAVMAPMAEELGTVSGGVLTAKVFPAGELGSGPVEQYNRAIDGVTDIAFGIPEYTPAQFPKTNLIALPGIAGSSTIETTEMLWDVKAEHLDEEFERVKLLALWAFDAAVLMTTEKRVESLADLEGLKIRSPGSMGTATLEAWGATPVNMPITEAYNALDTGVVDGIMVAPSAIRSFRLNEVIKYITVGQPTVQGAQYLIMNQDSWEALSPEQQAHLEKVSGKELSLQAAEAYGKAEQSGLDMAKESGIEIIELSPEAVAEFETAAQPVWEAVISDLEGQGVAAEEIVSAWQE